MPCPCHLENRRKYPCAGRSAQLVLSVFLFIVALGLTKDAVARIDTSSDSLSFGSVTAGTSLTQGVTLTNTGFRPETVSQATVTGAGFSISGPVLPLTLNRFDNATFNVEFAPAVGGSVTGTLSIVTNTWWNSTISISLSGTGVAQPTANLSPPSMTFASQALGSTSSAQAATLTNSGGTTLNITSIALTGANASDFAQTNTCGGSVAGGANCTISVTFTPAASGSRTASVSITDNASGSPQTVSLSGTGTGTATLVSLSPTSLAFGNQSLGTTSAAQALTLSNTGNAALSITSLALTGSNASDFAQTNTCGSSVAARSKCTISVTFKPSASGSRTASVGITDNASGSPQTVSLSGTGTGTAALVSLSPTSLAFGNQPIDVSSTTQSVILSNTGNGTLSITSLVLAGTNASDFAQTNTCGSALAAGANCTIVVWFTPSVAGTEAASLSISNNASGSSQTVSFSGTGIHDVILSWVASTTPGVVGYNVYRGITSGGESTTPLNSSPVAAGCTSTTTCIYSDATVVAGTTYYYTVAAVASNAVSQSANSNQVSATVPRP